MEEALVGEAVAGIVSAPKTLVNVARDNGLVSKEKTVKMARMFRALLLTLVMVVIGTTAEAVDMTGTWVGRERCACFDPVDGKSTERYRDEVMEITQDGTDLNILFFDELYNGNVIDHPSRSSKGEASLIACSTDPTDNARFGEIGRAKVWAKDGGRGKMSIESLWNAQEAQICTCTSRLRRTDPADPEIGDCSDENAVDAWHAAMLDVSEPPSGCYEAVYPSMEWLSVPCGDDAEADPALPGGRRNSARGYIGQTHDYVLTGDTAADGTVSGFLAVTGSFENIQGVTSITDSVHQTEGGLNYFTLQLNSGRFETAKCEGEGRPTNCEGWQQFVYRANGTHPGKLFIQYWLIHYNVEGDRTCPEHWTPYSYDCYKNSANTLVPAVTASQLGDLHLSGITTLTHDHAYLRVGDHIYKTKDGATDHVDDNLLGLSAAWTGAEFNVFGYGGGSKARFNSESSYDVLLTVGYPHGGSYSCEPLTYVSTLETNNLTLDDAVDGCHQKRAVTPPTWVFSQGN